MDKKHNNLIDDLIKGGYLKTDYIINAFRNTDRKDFIPEEYKKGAYVNAPLPIGFNQTISQPLTVAFMIELLQPEARNKILEVGAGSGWQTAILSYIVGNPPAGGGKVVAIERIPELKEMAEKNVSKYGFIKRGVAEIIEGDGSKGYKKEAPYDKIIAGAAASKHVPIEWKKQLKIGGRIVSPVENSIVVVDKIGENEYRQNEYFGFSFVPLISS